MRIFAVVLLLVAAGFALAQDSATLIKQAKKLEARAEKALDQGRNAEAFELLAQASVLRDQAKKAAVAAPQPVEPKQAKRAKKSKTRKKAAQAPGGVAPAAGMAVAAQPLLKTIESTFGSLDAAIEKGDQAAARQATMRLKRIVAAMARQLQHPRPAATPPAGDVALQRRLDALERQVAELRELMAKANRPRR